MMTKEIFFAVLIVAGAFSYSRESTTTYIPTVSAAVGAAIAESASDFAIGPIPAQQPTCKDGQCNAQRSPSTKGGTSRNSYRSRRRASFRFFRIRRCR